MTPPKDHSRPEAPFLTPAEYLLSLQYFQGWLTKQNIPKQQQDLRHRSLRNIYQAWQAATFAYAYAEAHSLGSLKVRPEQIEYSDRDATITWKENGKDRSAPVQLKELVPSTVNPTASVTRLLEQIAKKYPRSNDLIVAIYLNRHEFFSRITTPVLAISQLWFWGWSKSDHSELLLAGGSFRGTANHRIPYNPRAENVVPQS